MRYIFTKDGWKPLQCHVCGTDLDGRWYGYSAKGPVCKQCKAYNKLGYKEVIE